MKRSPLARRTPLKRTAMKRSRKRLRAVSAARQARIEERIECRNAVMHRCHGACEACSRLHSGPVRSAVDVHEVVARSAGGSIYDPANCLGVCRTCHTWITEHPRDAAVLGLHRRSWERTA